MITGDAYRASLRDGRAIWLEGHRVPDVTEDPVLAKSVAWVASTYDRHVGETHPMFRVPTTRDDLRDQMDALIGAARTATTTAACFADAYAGWDKVTNQVVDGGMHAQRMATLDAFDLEPARRRARDAAGIA